MARTDQPHKLKFESFVAQATDFSKELNEKHRHLDYSKPETVAVFNGRNSVVPIWCNIHSHFFNQKVGNHLSLGQGCPECSALVKAAKRRSTVWESDFTNAHGDRYDYSRVVYLHKDKKVEIICKQHGVFLQTPGSHRAGAGCPECDQVRKEIFGVQRTEDYKATFVTRANIIHNNKYKYHGEIGASHDWIDIECPKHGVFRQKSYSHLMGTGCASCPIIVSKPQKQIGDYIESLGFSVQHNHRGLIEKKEIDIYVAEKNFGVEYHGLYWHTNSDHKEKWELADKAGIRLIQIFEDEWVNKSDIIKSRLEAMLGVGKKFDARKCTIEEVEAGVATAFLDSTHIQGAGRAQLYYGLYNQEKLVAVASFCRARNGSMVTDVYSDSWEVMRFASIGRVRGGFSRLFKRFIADVNPDKVISYCDLRYGDGKVYAATGFKLDSITPPDYWWVPSGKIQRIPRYTTQKHKLATHPVLSKFYSPEKTENQICTEAGWEKIHGVGNQKWVWAPSTA